ncbi:hypothetical protein [uncultured Amnibacterium sp.]|uniref:hypothetical protein n=1 Tax=uncultured Amnibacterium sp. TaxID=1631851 RepID=UPI0035CAC262
MEIRDDEDEDEEREEDRPVRRVDEVLRILVDRLRADVAGRRLEQVDRAEIDLRRCIEQNAAGLFTDPELALLPLEQQLDPVGAVARVASADVLLLVLPIFLDDARWHGVDDEDRRLRVRFVVALSRAAVRLPELQPYSSGCAIWDIEAAVQRAHADLRRRRE